jgi:epoxyqueuosine reductase
MNISFEQINAKAQEIGFSAFGVTNLHTPKHYPHYKTWADKGFAGEMWYLTEDNRKQKRSDIREVFPAVQSIFTGAVSYKPQNDQHLTDAKFARYGWGKDYHQFVKEKFQILMDWMQQQSPTKFEYRIYVDTGPILEKSLAEEAGVGWVGKNTCLINQKAGSYLFLGEVLTSLSFESTLPATNHCGSCTKCLDACPTNAFVAPFQMDATKCISYHTIESKNLEMPEEIAKNLNGFVAGCDICQEVCPWNNKSPATTLPELTPGPHTSLSLEKILELTQDEYDSYFADTSFKRIPLEKLKANAKYNLD